MLSFIEVARILSNEPTTFGLYQVSTYTKVTKPTSFCLLEIGHRQTSPNNLLRSMKELRL